MRDHVRILNCISKDMPPVKGDSARLMQVNRLVERKLMQVGRVICSRNVGARQAWIQQGHVYCQGGQRKPHAGVFKWGLGMLHMDTGHACAALPLLPPQLLRSSRSP